MSGEPLNVKNILNKIQENEQKEVTTEEDAIEETQTEEKTEEVETSEKDSLNINLESLSSTDEENEPELDIELSEETLSKIQSAITAGTATHAVLEARRNSREQASEESDESSETEE